MCYWEASKTDQRSLRCVWSVKPSFSSLGGYIYGVFWLVVIIMFSGTLWHFIHSLCCTLFYLFILICQNKSKRKTVVYSSLYSLSIGPTGAEMREVSFCTSFSQVPLPPCVVNTLFTECESAVQRCKFFIPSGF